MLIFLIVFIWEYDGLFHAVFSFVIDYNGLTVSHGGLLLAIRIGVLLTVRWWSLQNKVVLLIVVPHSWGSCILIWARQELGRLQIVTFEPTSWGATLIVGITNRLIR